MNVQYKETKKTKKIEKKKCQLVYVFIVKEYPGSIFAIYKKEKKL